MGSPPDNWWEQIFKRSSQIAQVAGTLKEGKHCFPLSLCFPHSTADPHCGTICLPSSTGINTAGLKVTVAYVLKVKIQRQGILRFNTVKKTELLFRPLPQFRVISPTIGDCSRGIGNSAAAGAGPEYRAGIQPFPAAEDDHSGAAGLNPHKPLALALEVSVQPDLMQRLGPISLRNLVLRLRTTTAVCVGQSSREDVRYDPICGIVGDIPIAPAEGPNGFSLDPGIWKSHIVPLVSPTFGSSVLSIRHALEVICGFSTGTHKRIQCLRTGVEVIIADAEFNDPPPAYAMINGIEELACSSSDDL
ncbi:unnamed protein product [Colletotrichum noveboracense]|uniref:Uncharacterized protein n=1 Tax=Colletotrichum noveboracense TaxID=2664923 RepID=A0A9W4RWT5_9PEZI|nr:unnamed protein product [Colletotrichum noveboracense]